MKKIYDHYLIDYKDGQRESIEDLKTFYNKYMEFKKNKKMNTVARWCAVDWGSHITPLSQYGLDRLFLRATEPQTGGYVVFQEKREQICYKTDGGITKNLKNALVLSKKDAENELRGNRLYIGMKECSVAERDTGLFNN